MFYVSINGNVPDETTELALASALQQTAKDYNADVFLFYGDFANYNLGSIIPTTPPAFGGQQPASQAEEPQVQQPGTTQGPVIVSAVPQ